MESAVTGRTAPSSARRLPRARTGGFFVCVQDSAVEGTFAMVVFDLNRPR